MDKLNLIIKHITSGAINSTPVLRNDLNIQSILVIQTDKTFDSFRLEIEFDNPKNSIRTNLKASRDNDPNYAMYFSSDDNRIDRVILHFDKEGGSGEYLIEIFYKDESELVINTKDYPKCKANCYIESVSIMDKFEVINESDEGTDVKLESRTYFNGDIVLKDVILELDKDYYFEDDGPYGDILCGVEI